MRVDLLDYHLPESLIATEPPADRDGARLLTIDRATGALGHRMIRDLPSLVPAGALLVVNDTRVIPARLHGTKESGGRTEVFLLRPLDDTRRTWKALGRASKPIRAGAVVTVSDGLAVRVDARDDDGSLRVTLLADDPMEALERFGEVPLPPYVRRAPTESDRERYQTVYARHPGAVAAPTAGLHLTESLLAALEAKGVTRVSVTLHVGAGTFAPVTVDDLDTHPMHAEWYEVSPETQAAVREAKALGRPVVAIGTTAVRALESWGLSGATTGDTRLLIQPGYTWKVVDGLLTNFHLPRSTLLALVMAFAGEATTRNAYEAAVAAQYRFFSYGDAMLIL